MFRRWKTQFSDTLFLHSVRFWLASVVCGGIVFFSGCHTYNLKVNKAREAFYCNNLERATTQIVEERQKPTNAKSRDVLKLEEAMMRMCQGEFRQSETLLREVRDSFDALENQNARKGAEVAASMLTDDCSLSYRGEDYEKVMIRVMLALNSLMMDGADARAYAHQINLKQEEIISKSEVDPETNEKVKKSYKNLSIGPYICGILDDNNVSAQQDQIREFSKVTQWSPSFAGGKELLERARTSVSSQKGNGNVYVFALVGHGPYKVETNAEVTQAALIATDIIVSSTSKHSVPPTIAPVPIPCINIAPCRYRSAKITIDGGAEPILTEKITDINQIAIDQFEVNRPWIIARAAARRLLKKAGVYGVKEAVSADSWESELLLDLVGILWEGTEEADTRCWNLLPGSIQVARIELPAGEHELKMAGTSQVFDPMEKALQGATRYAVQKITSDFPTIPSPHVHRVWKKELLLGETLNPQSCTLKVNVEDGRNTYVFVYFGDYGLVGTPHANTP